MVRTQQRVAQATQQSLPGGQRVAVAHAEGMVGEGRAGDQQQPQETHGGLAQRPGRSQKIGQGRSSSVVVLAGVLTDAGGAGRFTAAGQRRICTGLSPFPSVADPR